MLIVELLVVWALAILVWLPKIPIPATNAHSAAAIILFFIHIGFINSRFKGAQTTLYGA
jgi:heme A synthase